ncbi:protein serine/threonine phosphatase 2C [Serendipita vermifera]|nr:protein serine/threonine phosphatase 2C [Serendipita vermifera]
MMGKIMGQKLWESIRQQMEIMSSWFMFTHCCPPEPGAAWPATDGGDPDSPTPLVVGTDPEDNEGFFRMPFGRGLDADGGNGVISCLSGIISTLISRLRPVAVALLAAGGGSYTYYRYYKHGNESSVGETFNISIRQRDAQGKLVNSVMVIPYSQDATLEKRVKTFAQTLFSESASSFDSRKRALIQFHGAQLNSNSPVEDMEPEATAYVYENSTRRPLVVAAVADGHSGPYTSAWLQSQLTSLMVRVLLHDKGFEYLNPLPKSEDGTIHIPSAFRLDPKRVGSLLKKSFEAVDHTLVWAQPQRLLQLAKEKMMTEDDLEQMKGLILPGYSGACALATVVDTDEQQLWVASTGDCRAIAGFWDEKSDGTGQWRVDVLSEDQTAESPKEVARLIREHPKDNPGNVVARGRVLGSLQPSRSFGDLRYKWSYEMQTNDLPKILPPGIKQRPPPANLQTPPYVTASPEIQYRRFELPTSIAGSSSGTRSTLRFLVLATDGLWDQLSNSDTVALVGGHMSGFRGTVPSGQLRQKFPTAEDTSTKTSNPLPHSASSSASRQAGWVFRNEGLGMHLIRNALGGDDEKNIRQTLSIPPPFSRRFRDDITVAIITFEDQGTSPDLQIRAKL